MEKIKIETLINPRESDFKVIDDGISLYNNSKIGMQKYIPIGCFAKIDSVVIGGIKGNLFWNYLYIDLMWVDEKYRHEGIGKKLVSEAEKLSIANGIFRSHLCTASFQALDFYLKCGYKVIGQLDDMPEGETEYYLYKKLEADKVQNNAENVAGDESENISFEELKKDFTEKRKKSGNSPIEQ